MALPPQNNSNNRKGSGFTNLNRYLNANQSNRLGNTVAAGVQQAGQGASGALTQANQDFQQKAAAEQQRLAGQGQKVNQVLGNVAGATDDDVKNFESIRNATSQGPTGVADANALRSKAQEAEGLGRAGGSEAGRFGLLQRFVGRGNQNYNAGNQRLDQMLLGQTGQQQLRSARTSTYGLGNQAEHQISGAAAQGEELKGKARQLAEGTIDKLGQSASGYDAEMQQKLADKKAAINSIIGGVATGGNQAVELDENMLKQLTDASGGLLNEGTGLYKSDLSPYLAMNDLYATKQGVQSQDDLARAKKLGLLSGNSLAGKDAGNTLQDYLGHQDLAGSFDANNQFAVKDKGGLSDALNKAKSDYEGARSTASNNINNFENQLAAQNNSGTMAESNYYNLLKKYSTDQAEQAAAKEAGMSISDFRMKPSYVQDPLIQRHTPDWAKNLEGNVALTNYYHPGEGGSSADLARGNIPINDPDYLKSIYGGLQPHIDEAKAWASGGGSSPNSWEQDFMRNMVGNINQREQDLTAAQKRYGEIPTEFNILRTLKAKQKAVQANPVVGEQLNG